MDGRGDGQTGFFATKAQQTFVLWRLNGKDTNDDVDNNNNNSSSSSSNNNNNDDDRTIALPSNNHELFL